MISILLLLAVFPVKGMNIPGGYNYQEPTRSLDPGNDRSSAVGAREPEAFGANTARAIFMKPKRMGTSDLARMMVNEMEIMRDFFGPGFDRPIRDMVDSLMHSTPDEIMHAVIDPIMSSPKSQETLGELDRQLADFITGQLGDPQDTENEFLGENTINSLIEYATGQLPRITAFQFALQLMFQFQIQFASMMETMTTITLGEIMEPIMNILAQMPNKTPSEAAQMLAEPMVRNEVNLGSIDEAAADFIRGLQTSPAGPSRQTSPAGPSRCPSPDSFGRQCIQYVDQCSINNECAQGQSCCLVAGCGRECVAPQNPARPVNGDEQADFARLTGSTGNTSPQNSNLNRQAFANQGPGITQGSNGQQLADQRSRGFQNGNRQQTSGQGSNGFQGIGQQFTSPTPTEFQGRTNQLGSGRQFVQETTTRSQTGQQGFTGQQNFNQRPSNLHGNAGQSIDQFGQQHNTGSGFADLQQQGFDIPDPFAQSSRGRNTGHSNSGFRQSGSHQSSGQPGQFPQAPGFQQPSQSSGGSGSGRPIQSSRTPGFGEPSQSFGTSGFQQPSQSGRSFQQPSQSSGGSGSGRPIQSSGTPGFGEPSQSFGTSGFQQPSQSGRSFQQPSQSSGGSGRPIQSSGTPAFGEPSQSFRTSGFQQPSQSGRSFQQTSQTSGSDFGSLNPGSQQPSETNDFQQSIFNPIIQSLGTGLNQVNRLFRNGPDTTNQAAVGTNLNTGSSRESGSSSESARGYNYQEPRIH